LTLDYLDCLGNIGCRDRVRLLVEFVDAFFPSMFAFSDLGSIHDFLRHGLDVG